MSKRIRMMKRALSFVMALAMFFALVPVTVFAADTDITVYLKPNSNWLDAGARFAVAVAPQDWSTTTWHDMSDTDGDGIYEVTIPAGNNYWIVFCRMNPGTTENNWDNKWDQTNDLTLPTDGTNCYTVADGAWSKGEGTWSTYTPSTGEDSEDSGNNEEAAAYYVAGANAAVFGEAWACKADANVMTLNAETGLYEKSYASVPVGTLAFKVTDGTWDNSWGKDGGADNFTYEVSAISNVTITFNASTKEIKVTSEATGEVAESVTNVTIHYRNTGVWSDVYYHAWIENGDNDQGLTTWPGTKLTENAGHTNWYTVELKELNVANGIGILFHSNGGVQTGDIMITKNGEYWYDGALLTEEPDNFADGSVALVDYEVTLHFANSLNWGSVNLYTWTATGANPTGSWPGSAAGLDSDGFYSLNFTYKAPEGQGLNFIFSGSNQTVDLALSASDFVENKAEKWVVPTTDDGNGKYYADIVSNPDAIAISPVVNDKSVSFEYKGADASSVQVYGTMNNWASGYAMTKNDYGVWSVTINDVAYGLHQYKLVVDDNWVIDPLNSWVVTEDSGNQNSAFLISDPSKDENKVIINVHFDPPSEEWNVCAWGAPNLQGQYNFENGVAKIEIDGRASQYLAFKVRKSIKGNSWAEQSGEIRVDLASIVSGTIDIYVGSDFKSSQSLNADVVYANKIAYTQLDYDNNTITVVTSKAVADPETAFSIYYKGEDAKIISSISVSGSTYTLTLNKTLDLVTLYQHKVRFAEQKLYTDYDYDIGINTVYASDKFAKEFTYTGTDLGATYTSTSTKFVVWAPTAEEVAVKLYATGSDAEDGAANLGSYKMTRGDKGQWTISVEGDLNGTYYTYAVTVDGETVEAVDPYARTTGVNGQRGMVIDLDSTDPEGWENDTNPNRIDSYTDAIIYELHVRDFSIDDSSGVSDANQGKYLAFTETGTTVNGEGEISTGIDYLKELGITHLHLLPVYDYGSVDETECDTFNWGYDPVNYNTPEGSYSTDPYNGETRVKEFKQMVSSLHDAGISVIMDVVYNHVYDAGKFCMNQIVPDYFSRTNIDGSYSEGSGCGNDTASEREMVRKYIVESVLYWHQEYHIDGFRFDLVGLLDATTINEIVKTVHACCPDVIFYGEGWTLGTAVEPGNTMATQANSSATPGFAYFSDTIRNLLAGSNGTSLGFVSGLTGQEEAVANNFMANTWWSYDPTQIVQYASCHDNYTLIDKLILSTDSNEITSDIIKMNNLTAAIYMTSQGIPFIHAGEEMLREKLEEDGGRCENSYNASDYVNHIEWSNLKNELYADTSAYYQGLIEFRKAHPALRLDTRAEIDAAVEYTWITNEVVMFTIDGTKVEGETAKTILVIFNATNYTKEITLPEGEWIVCIDDTEAGAEELHTVSDKVVNVPGISAMVLVENPIAFNEDTGVQYETLTEALSAAKANETVTLQKDVSESSVVVTDSVTLDLNGYMLDSDYLVAFNGSHLIDSHEEKGILQIAKESLMLPADNAHIPVWTGEGYVFNELSLSYEKMNTDDANYVFKSSFKPSFGKLSVDENLYIAKKYFVDEQAASDNGIQIILRLSWENASGNKVSQDFLYSNELVQKVYADPESRTVFTLGVTRLASDADVTVTVVVISDAGVEKVSGGLTYTG